MRYEVAQLCSIAVVLNKGMIPPQAPNVLIAVRKNLGMNPNGTKNRFQSSATGAAYRIMVFPNSVWLDVRDAAARG